MEGPKIATVAPTATTVSGSLAEMPESEAYAIDVFDAKDRQVGASGPWFTEHWAYDGSGAPAFKFKALEPGKPYKVRATAIVPGTVHATTEPGAVVEFTTRGGVAP